MTRNNPIALLLLSSALSFNSAFAEDQKQYLSVVPATNNSLPKASPATNNSPAKTSSPAGSPGAAAKAPESGPGEAEASTAPTARSFYSSVLEQSVSQYKSSPNQQSYSQLFSALKSVLAGASGLRLSVPVLVKDNPYLAEFRPKVLESGGLRLWTFPKASERNRALLQWIEVHQQTTGVGRRKRVVTSTTTRFQEMQFSRSLNIRDTGIVSSKDGNKYLLFSGNSDDGSLAIIPFKLTESGWQENSEFLNQIPGFLSSNLCGRLSFKGNDLVFTVGKMIKSTDSTGVTRFFPEAESNTFKFLLKAGDQGYVVSPNLPDEDAFSVVYQFMQAVSQGRSDAAKALLADPKGSALLVSIPKYLGLQGKPIDPAVKVVEMSLPPGHGNRFRLINLGKDDLIFDLGKYKNQWLVRAIFIAAPDPFLEETSRYYPLLSRFEPRQESADKKITPDPSLAANTSGPPKKK